MAMAEKMRISNMFLTYSVGGSQLGELSEVWTEGTWEGFMSVDDLYGEFLTLVCFDMGLHSP
jgi:hypothetical protein